MYDNIEDYLIVIWFSCGVARALDELPLVSKGRNISLECGIFCEE